MVDHQKSGMEASTSVSTHSLSSAQVFPSILSCECSWSGRKRGRRVPPARLIPYFPVSNPTQDSVQFYAKQAFRGRTQTGRVTVLTLIGIHTQTYNYTLGYTVTLGHTHTHTQTHTECLGQLFLVVPGPQIYECRGVHPVLRVKVIISTCKSQELSRPKVQSSETPEGLHSEPSGPWVLFVPMPRCGRDIPYWLRW